jgi:hypothetical protein
MRMKMWRFELIATFVAPLQVYPRLLSYILFDNELNIVGAMAVFTVSFSSNTRVH